MTLHLDKCGFQRVCQKLADAADAAVSEVVDIVDRSVPFVNADQILHRRHKIILCQTRFADRKIKIEFLVQFITADLSQVVAPFREKHIGEIFLGVFKSNRLARHQHIVDGRQRLVFGHLAELAVFGGVFDRLFFKTVNDDAGIQGAFRLKIDERNFFDAEFRQFGQIVFVNFVAGGKKPRLFAVLFNGHVAGKNPVD